MVRVGEHGLDGRADLLRRSEQRDCVAGALAHLGPPVDPGEPSHGRHESPRLGQHFPACLTIDAPHDLVRLLDHRELVFPDGDQRGLKCRDVCRLRDGIAKEAGGNVALESSLDDLLLHGRVPFKPAHGDVIYVKHRLLRERWKARLHVR
jgi:hypothetical protein